MRPVVPLVSREMLPWIFYHPVDDAKPQIQKGEIVLEVCIYFMNILRIFYEYCVTRAPLLYFVRNWVALSFKVCESVRPSGIGNTLPDLHFVQYIKAKLPSTDPVSPITNCYRLIVSYTDPVHSFIIS